MNDCLHIATSPLFVKAVVERLKTFGYEVTNEDKGLLSLCIQKVCLHIMNSCNTSSVPTKLFYVAVDRTCGEFLYVKNQTGSLEMKNIDLDGAITQIHEGDTTVQFGAGASQSEKFTAFLNYLMNEGEGDFICYRKIKW